MGTLATLYPLSTAPMHSGSPAPSAPISTTITYTCNSLYRLTDAEYSTGEFYQYAYDPVGNRLSLTTTVGVVNYQYDAANRLTTVNGQAYTWDDNGNLLNDGMRSYTYDHANRLTQVVSGTLTTQFTYNGAGDRVARTVDGIITDYVLDPAAGLTQVLQETTNGQTTGYPYGADLLAQYDSGTWAYHVNDGLGSVRQLVDAAGQVEAAVSYSPFGVPAGAVGSAYAYTGERWDTEVELLYLRARYYQPATGRFLTMDSWSGDMRRPSTLNRGIYVTNNPINLSDPSGYVPTQGTIKRGRHSFSCNCGWIDWGHASPATARRIIEQVGWEDFQRGSPEYKLITVREPAITPFLIYMAGAYVEAEAIVRRSLSEPEQDSVALGIFMEISERFEASWSQRLTGSSYTLEDLPSDLIGFYVALKTEKEKTGETGAITDEELRALVDEECNVIDEKDRDDYIKWTLRVYDDYERAGLLEKKNRNWCRAWLLWSCTIAEQCTMHPQWPSAYSQIAPEHSRLKGQWWWAEDDPRIMSWGRLLVDTERQVWAVFPLPPHPILGLP